MAVSGGFLRRQQMAGVGFEHNPNGFPNAKLKRVAGSERQVNFELRSSAINRCRYHHIFTIDPANCSGQNISGAESAWRFRSQQ
jgi:hypothetical protein